MAAAIDRLKYKGAILTFWLGRILGIGCANGPKPLLFPHQEGRKAGTEQPQEAMTRLGSSVVLAKFSSKPCRLPTAFSCERITANRSRFVSQGHFSSFLLS